MKNKHIKSVVLSPIHSLVSISETNGADLESVAQAENQVYDLAKYLKIVYITTTNPSDICTLCVKKDKHNNNGNVVNLPSDTTEAVLETIIPRGSYHKTWAVGINRTIPNPNLELNGQLVNSTEVAGAMFKYGLIANQHQNLVKLSLSFYPNSKQNSKIGIWFGK
jgi:hypothetical protein